MTPRFILASASPRRHEILTMLGINFEVMVSDCDESADNTFAPDELVCKLSYRKAEAVFDKLPHDEDIIVIGADTIVWDGSMALGKPLDANDAINTLKSLSGKEHSVFSGISMIGIIDNKRIASCQAAETKVKFAKLSEGEIRYYVETGEPLDKAGSYGIQGLGGIFVSELHGDHYNVVGLPIALMRTMLERDFGLTADDYIGKVR